MRSAWKRIALGAGLSAAASLLLGLLPLAGHVAGKQHQPLAVFRQEQPRLLASSNVVDVLGGLELSQHIKRVRWSSGVLSIDLAAAKDATARSLNQDLLELLRVSFVHLDNVERLLVRVLERQKEAGIAAADDAQQEIRWALLLASDVRRTDPQVASWVSAPTADDLLLPHWQERLRLVYTPLWRERFGASTR